MSLDGLNDVPLVAEPESPTLSTSRTALLSARKSSSSVEMQKTSCPDDAAEAASFEGNYEGDKTMFRGKDNQKVAEKEQQSDEEELHQVPGLHSDKQSWCVQTWDKCRRKLFTPTQWELISGYASGMKENRFCKKFIDLLKLAYTLMAWLTHMSCLGLVNFYKWSSGVWQISSLLRSAARTLIWRVSVARSSELWLFTLILLISPILFAIAILGVLITAFGRIKALFLRS